MSHDYAFSGEVDPKSRAYEAYKITMDIRKFEIELFWKRAAYFWTFIGVSLAAYTAILTAKVDTPALYDRSDVLYCIAMIGLVFAFAWYLVNRGSKFWQRNWEFQADLLEDKVIGPLYKTVFSDNRIKLLSLTGAYPFSVSSINLVLSTFVIVIFILLAVHANPCYGLNHCAPSSTKLIATTVATIFVVLLVWKGRSGLARIAGSSESESTAPSTARFIVRTVEVRGDISRPT